MPCPASSSSLPPNRPSRAPSPTIPGRPHDGFGEHPPASDRPAAQAAMTAGAYGGALPEVLWWAGGIARRGGRHHIDAAGMGFGYRHTSVPADWIFTGARLRATPGDQLAIARRIAEIDAARQDSQPRSRTGGSTFVNPPGDKAWQLIDRAGCRGLVMGGAQVSEQHCNFLINLGDASAADIEMLGE